jgi:hypothetical protein
VVAFVGAMVRDADVTIDVVAETFARACTTAALAAGTRSTCAAVECGALVGGDARLLTGGEQT